ncbi:MAG: acyl carrier protein [Firmicutes bacterium]|nr:acyl carrier protein [Bacillota bacterium]
MDREKIINILAQILNIDIEKLNQVGDSDDLSQYSLNSLKAVKLMVRLEEELDVEIDDDDLFLKNVDTIEKIRLFTRKYELKD